MFTVMPSDYAGLVVQSFPSGLVVFAWFLLSLPLLLTSIARSSQDMLLLCFPNQPYHTMLHWHTVISHKHEAADVRVRRMQYIRRICSARQDAPTLVRIHQLFYPNPPSE